LGVSFGEVEEGVHNVDDAVKIFTFAVEATLKHGLKTSKKIKFIISS
jgi:hypothetical protein